MGAFLADWDLTIGNYGIRDWGLVSAGFFDYLIPNPYSPIP